MTEPHCPEGWPQELADTFWDDYLAAADGGDPPPLTRGNDISEDEATMYGLVPDLIRLQRTTDGKPMASWRSREARLRGWASVGAPVVPVGGLAEWVAVATTARLAPHSSVIGVPGDIGLIRLCLYHCAVDIHEDLTHPTVYRATVSPYLGQRVEVNSPAELRTILDHLARSR